MDESSPSNGRLRPRRTRTPDRSSAPTRVRAPAGLAAAASGAFAILLSILVLHPPVAHAQEAAAAEENEATDADSLFWSAFEWRSIGPVNFGGRITDIEGVPHPSRTFYVAAASGGIWKTTNNGTTFRPVFDDQGVGAMGDIAVAPSDTSVVWAGTGEEDSRNSISPGDGVYRSTDGGMSWTHMGLEDSQAIGRIVIHPGDPQTVYVAALGHIWGANEERGLYRTRDGGETWERIHFVSDSAGFVDVAMHPDDPDVMLASSWERVRGPWFLQSGGPGSALWKTTDGGDTWTEVEGGGFPETMKGRIGIAYAPGDPDVVYALVEAEDPESDSDDAEADEEAAAEGAEGEEAEEEAEDGAGGSGLYRSEDGGETWTFTNDRNTRPFYYSQVRVDPSDPDRVYWSSTPVQFSKDGGETVGEAALGIHVDHHAMWWDPADPDHFIVGNDGGVHVTWDKGGTYDFINTIPLGQFYAISLGHEIPYRVCGGLQDNGTWCGPSRRANGPITKHMWATINGGDGFYSAQDPENPDVVYAESQGGNMARMNMSTGDRAGMSTPSWQEATQTLRDSIVELGGDLHPESDDDSEEASLDPEVRERIEALRERVSADSARLDLRWNWSTPFFLSPHDRETLYAGANRVVMSANQGDEWEVVSPDLTTADSMKIRVSTETTGGITEDVTGAETHATITTLAESPLVVGRLYAGTDDGKVWIRPDASSDWVDLTDRFAGVPEGTWVSRVEPSHHDPDRFYVSFDGHRSDDFTPYVHVTDDGGDTFRSIADDLPRGGPDYVHVVREDPVNPDLLFVGTDVGVYASLDRGRTWRRFMEGMPTVPVRDLRVHPRDRELVAGTHGRSIWIVDIAPLQELAGVGDLTAGLENEPRIFEPKPGLQHGDPPVGGETPGHRWFEGESPRYGAELAVWLPEAVGPGAAVSEEDAEPPAVDPTGEWTLSVSTPMGQQASTATLEMAEDGTLTGSVEGERAGGEISEGRVSGRSFRFVVSMEMMGRSMEATYAGELEQDDRMTGTVSFGGQFSADFTGRPAGAEPEPADQGESGDQETEDEPGPVRIAILDAAGDTVETMDAPTGRGLHRVYWNLRRSEEPEPLGPAARQDSLHLASMMRSVADSLIETGRDSGTVNEVVDLFQGGDRGAIFSAFGGSPGGGGEAWDPRPGESYPEAPEAEEKDQAVAEAGAETEDPAEEQGAREQTETGEEEPGEEEQEAGEGAEERAEAGGGDRRGVMRDMFGAMRDRGASFSFFGGQGGGSTPVEPGTYRVVLTVENATYETTLEVLRAEDYVVDDDADEDAAEAAAWRELMERLREGEL